MAEAKEETKETTEAPPAKEKKYAFKNPAQTLSIGNTTYTSDDLNEITVNTLKTVLGREEGKDGKQGDYVINQYLKQKIQ